MKHIPVKMENDENASRPKSENIMPKTHFNANFILNLFLCLEI